MHDTTHSTRLAAALAPTTDPIGTPAAPRSPAPAGAGDLGGLLPYAAPAIIFRTPLEAVAASCYSAPGKADLISCLVGNS